MGSRSFEPEPDSFVAPARTQAQSYHPGDGIRVAEVTVHRLARRVNGVTVGRMPGRQLCFYDKRADSLAKHKFYWPAVWGLDLAEHREPVWRAEVRASRDELARHLARRSSEAVEAALADIVASILSKVRYVIPTPTDINPGRWPIHPLWDAVGRHLVAAIKGHELDPGLWRPGPPTPREIKRDMIARQLVGLSRSYPALAGLNEGRAEELPELVAALLRDDWRQRPEGSEQGLARARARYCILDQ